MIQNKINRYLVFSYCLGGNSDGWKAFNFSTSNLSVLFDEFVMQTVVDYHEWVQIVDIEVGNIIFSHSTDNFEANFKLFYEKYGVDQLLHSSVE